MLICSPSLSKPEWWNWQTQETQNLPISRSWGFDSLLGHHLPGKYPAAASPDAGLLRRYSCNGFFHLRLILDNSRRGIFLGVPYREKKANGAAGK